MHKEYISLGLMSGTSGDGVDASIIISDGLSKFESIKNEYYEYDNEIYDKIHYLKDKINTSKDLKKNDHEIKNLEREITIFHAKIIKGLKIDGKDSLIGFHGQTIFHDSSEKISKQLGDANLLYQLTKNKIIYNFRKNDIQNGGEGAPLTPIFHQLIASKINLKLPICILNIGGISNITIIKNLTETRELFSKDIGPGNCLIDNWIRKNSKKKFDENGLVAASGEINEIILEQAQELYLNRNFKKKLSFDVNDFDISFARGLSLADGTRTLTEFTANIIAESLLESFSKFKVDIKDILLCGGGRKNKFLINSIKKNINEKLNLKQIDNYKIDGDFIESQAFAFLAIRSFKNLPISFPNTTGCSRSCTGGELIEN